MRHVAISPRPLINVIHTRKQMRLALFWLSVRVAVFLLKTVQYKLADKLEIRVSIHNSVSLSNIKSQSLAFAGYSSLLSFHIAVADVCYDLAS